MAFPWIEFLGLMIAFGINAVVPGLDFAMVLKQSITHGRRAAIFTSAGVAASIFVHGSYTILGIGLIVSQSILLFNLLKIFGVIYLLWIGISAMRAPAPVAPEGLDQVEHTPISNFVAFTQGFLTNLLNPKAVLFFLALFTSLVSAHTSAGLKGFYVVCMSTVLFTWFALVSIFFTTPKVRGAFFRFGKWFNRITGGAFILLAASVALTKQH